VVSRDAFQCLGSPFPVVYAVLCSRFLPAGSQAAAVEAFRERLAAVQQQLATAKAGNRQTDDNMGCSIDAVCGCVLGWVGWMGVGRAGGQAGGVFEGLAMCGSSNDTVQNRHRPFLERPDCSFWPFALLPALAVCR
jgi:hypothetical protein